MKRSNFASFLLGEVDKEVESESEPETSIDGPAGPRSESDGDTSSEEEPRAPRKEKTKQERRKELDDYMENFDEGEILGQEYVEVNDKKTIYEIHTELAKKQTLGILKVLNQRSESGKWVSFRQNEKDASYVCKRMILWRLVGERFLSRVSACS